VKLLSTISRPEFLPANLASLIIGISWGINSTSDLIWGLAIPAILISAIITLVAAFGAQVNTMSDYELDLRDSRKKELVKAMGSFGQSRLKKVMIIELLFSSAFMLILLLFHGKPALLLMWIGGVFLAYAYSAPPLTLKSRSWLAVIAMLIVLSILPISFVYHSFTSILDPFFLVFLSGQALTVYGVIIPAEIRDYFGDKAMKIKTMTVRLGLVKSSLFGILLLILGGIFCGTGIFLRLVYGPYPTLAAFVLILATAYSYVLWKYRKLYLLSKEYMSSEADLGSIEQDITGLSAQNPRWITLVTQAIVLTSLVLLVAKFLP
jgi:4-hydroxybenzoate polyprenyltransferase